MNGMSQNLNMKRSNFMVIWIKVFVVLIHMQLTPAVFYSLQNLVAQEFHKYIFDFAYNFEHHTWWQ